MGAKLLNSKFLGLAGSGADTAPGPGAHHGPVARDFMADTSDLVLLPCLLPAHTNSSAWTSQDELCTFAKCSPRQNSRISRKCRVYICSIMPSPDYIENE